MIAPHIFMLSNNKNKYVAAERQSTIGKYYSDDSNPIFDAIDKFVHSSSIRFLIDHDGVKTCRILLKAFYNSSARYFQSVASFSSGLLPAKILVLCLSSALVDSAKAINQARAHVSEIARLDSMVRENVIVQIANIKTHPPAALGLEPVS
ncbi:hypothetical protein J8V44_16030 [Photorhabdus bodei]|nr:hypothetical protein [Photorhabdus bodei]